MATLTFLGAAQEVTGSCHLLQSPVLGRVLLDCGMHQGGDAVSRAGKEHFLFAPASIDAVILSHAHLDHSGMLPKLVHEGFSGPIYCTAATADLLQILLKDAAGLYQRDLERANIRRARAGRKLIKPQYDMEDVEEALARCCGHAYTESIALSPDATLRFYDAGHILGAAIVQVTLREQEQQKTLVFSGDLGNQASVLMGDPSIIKQADLVLMEGTYGNRNHRTMDDSIEQFADILAQTWQKNGNVMIPSFAVGRTQEILFHLGRLYHQGRLDNWQIFLDSPMAIEVTQVHDKWLKLLDPEDIKQLTKSHHHTLEGFLPPLRLCGSSEESMAINRIQGGAIIIAGSGMCTGGRIRHHFKHRIWNERNTVIFIGFQARGTLGRRLVDGEKEIKMFSETFQVRATIETLGGFSAHAGQSQLIEWLGHFENNPRVYLVHGEAASLECLSQTLWLQKGIKAVIPEQGRCIAF